MSCSLCGATTTYSALDCLDTLVPCVRSNLTSRPSNCLYIHRSNRPSSRRAIILERWTTPQLAAGLNQQRANHAITREPAAARAVQHIDPSVVPYAPTFPASVPSIHGKKREHETVIFNVGRRKSRALKIHFPGAVPAAPPRAAPRRSRPRRSLSACLTTATGRATGR